MFRPTRRSLAIFVALVCALGIVQVVLAAPPAAEFTIDDDTPLTGQTVTFTSAATDEDGDIALTEWDFDYDGTFVPDDLGSPATHTYATAGSRTVAMRVTDGLDNDASIDQDLVTHTVTVSDPPNVDPSASLTVTPTVADIGQTVSFGAGGSNDPDGSIVSYEWDLDGDGTYETDTGTTASTNRSYSTAGTRLIGLRVTDNDGATATDSASLRVNAVPSASFTISPNPAQINQTVTFNAGGSSDPDGSIARYEWDLDGNGSYEVDGGSSPTTTRTYTSAGTRTIRLRVTDNDGATATDSATLDINARPTASFTISPNPASIGATVSFNASASDDTDGTIVKYEWDLDGNGTYETDSGNSSTTSRSYATGGTRTIRLRVTDDQGATALDSDTLVVSNVAPTASFTAGPNPAQIGATVGFNGGASSDPEGPITKYEWDLDGNGTYELDTGTTATTSRSYTTAGTRLVGLRVTDEEGARDTATVSVRVNAVPIARSTITPNPAPTGTVVTFDGDTSSDSDGTIVKYEWDLDGNGTYEINGGSSPTTSRSYATSGPRTIRLRVTDDDGSTAVDTDTLNVSNRAPNASFTVAPNPAQIGATVSFNGGASSDPEGGIAKYEWDLDGNGSYETDTGTAATTSRSYATAGTRLIGLRVTDAQNATDTATVPLRINARPAPSFTITPNPALTGESVSFNAGPSDDSDGTIVRYEWDLDGNGSFEVNGGANATTSRAYGSATTIGVVLRVTDNDGATATLGRDLRIQETRPNAALSFAPTAPLPGQAVTFTSRSSPSGSPGNPQITGTEWDFNYDPTGPFAADASGTSAQTVFSTPGPKSVAIKVTETGGGYAIAVTTVVVNAAPRASFTVAPGAPLDGDTVTLASTSSDPDGPLGSQVWDLDGDGQYDDASGPVASRAFGDGSHTVRLRVTDSRGASAMAQRTIVVARRPPKLLPPAQISVRGVSGIRGARFKKLAVKAPAKTRVKVRCKGRTCPKGTVSKRMTRSKFVRFKKFERWLRAGTKIIVTVTRTDHIGRHITLTVRGRFRGYKRTDRCLSPGSTRPRACGS